MKQLSLTSPIINNIVSKPSLLIRYEDSDSCQFYYKKRENVPVETVSLTYLNDMSIGSHEYNGKKWGIDSRYIVKIVNPIIAGSGLFDVEGNFYPDSVRRRAESCGKITLFNMENPTGLEVPMSNIRYAYLRRFFREKLCKISNFIHINEPAFFLPVDYSAYGHFLLEGIGRLWALKKVREYVKNIKILTNSSKSTWFLDLVRPFGYTEDNIIFLGNAIASVKELWVTTPLASTSNFLDREQRKVFNIIFDYYYDKKYSSPDKVYLSRSLISKRKLLEESEVESFMKKKGYSIIYPEKLDIQNQVNLFNACKNIVCPIGTAQHNILYNQTDSIASNLLIMPRVSSRVPFTINGNYSINTSVFLGDTVGEGRSNSKEWRINFDLFKKNFKKYE